MKIRAGFVSNSSSSTFLVTFPRKPESYQDLFQMMFPNSLPTEMLEVCDHCISKEQVVEQVWDDITDGAFKDMEGGPTFRCSFTYADENGSFGTCMEHGDIFYNLEHERISNH